MDSLDCWIDTRDLAIGACNRNCDDVRDTRLLVLGSSAGYAIPNLVHDKIFLTGGPATAVWPFVGSPYVNK
jgi:hypothetical protein